MRSGSGVLVGVEVTVGDTVGEGMAVGDEYVTFTTGVGRATDGCEPAQAVIVNVRKKNHKKKTKELREFLLIYFSGCCRDCKGRKTMSQFWAIVFHRYDRK